MRAERIPGLAGLMIVMAVANYALFAFVGHEAAPVQVFKVE